MKGLLKNEISLFFNRRNLFIIILYFLILILFVQFVFVPNYNSYYEDQYNKISTIKKPLEAVSNYREIEISNNFLEIQDINMKMFMAGPDRQKNLKKKLERLEEEIEELEKNNEPLNQIVSNLGMLESAYKEPKTNYALIEDSWQEIDDYLDYLVSNDVDLNTGGLFLEDARDWNKRKLLRDADADINFTYELNEEYPSSIRTTYNFLNGKNWYFAGLIVIILVFLNYDLWSMEFDEKEGKIIYTIPFSKKAIFRSRLFTRLCLNILVILAGLLIAFIYSAFRFGIGPNFHVIINSNVVDTMFRISTDLQNLWKTDIPIKMSTYIGYSLVLVVFFIIFIFSIINFISLAFKNSSISIISGLALVGTLINVDLVKIKNPFSFYRVDDILMNGTSIAPSVIAPTNMGLGYYIVVLLLASFVLSIISEVIFRASN
ncbi:ABC transporter permease [Neofamilia massiliensis]|uniref:ABC transporter permease n=1 Tax=Neofamilia massiliensis TaxID=1673724 RepID=UPI0006BB6A99|nr:ABC transporter permease [Neofamilia massiliensis]